MPGQTFERWNGHEFVLCRLAEVRRGHIVRDAADPTKEYRAIVDGREPGEITVEPFGPFPLSVRCSG